MPDEEPLQPHRPGVDGLGPPVQRLQDMTRTEIEGWVRAIVRDEMLRREKEKAYEAHQAMMDRVAGPPGPVPTWEPVSTPPGLTFSMMGRVEDPMPPNIPVMYDQGPDLSQVNGRPRPVPPPNRIVNEADMRAEAEAIRTFPAPVERDDPYQELARSHADTLARLGEGTPSAPSNHSTLTAAFLALLGRR